MGGTRGKKEERESSRDNATRQERPQALRSPDSTAPAAATSKASSDSPSDSDRATSDIGEYRGISIGRFVVIDVAGEGGMGMVMSAYDPMLNRRVAIKILHTKDDANGSKGGKGRLVREAQAMARIQHPNVVTVFDTGEHEGQLFVAMEYVEGGTFRDWLQQKLKSDEPASWREVLGVLIPAGRGLAAAHQSDLVHRDFKPENILLSETGEVKVADFGLVSASSAYSVEGMDDLALTNNGRLTMEGSIMGTPSYMAPEQFSGTKVDEQADQFAFAVVLYEALFGALPFKADTFLELAAQATAGKVIPPPDESPVPKWLLKAVMRSLSPEPPDRFPSIDALLNELSKDRSKRFALVVGMGVVLAVGGGAAWAMQGDASSPVAACQDSRDQVAEVWNPTIQNSIRQSFERTGRDYADRLWTTVQDTLESRNADWVSMRTSACEASHVHKTQSLEVLDQRMACLDRRLQEMTALTSELVEADADTLLHAAEASLGLGTIEGCSLASIVANGQSERLTPEQRPHLESLQRKLSSARIKGELGNYAQAAAGAQKIYLDADAIQISSVAAEAGLVLGQSQWRQGKLEEAVDSLVLALTHAQKVGTASVKLSIYAELIYVLGWELAHWEDALRWGVVAEAQLETNSASSQEKHNLYYALGTVEGRAWHNEECVLRFEAALEAIPGNSGSPLLRARTLDGLGVVSQQMGDYEAALTYARSALEIQEDTLGIGHPDTSDSLNNIGTALASQGDFPRARIAVLKSLRISEAAFGKAHPNVADALNNLGAIDFEEGRYQSAISNLERAVPIVERLQGKEHPDVATLQLNVGTAYLRLKRPDEAVTALEHALRIHDFTTEDTIQKAQIQFTLAQALAEANGDAGRSRDLAERAAIAYESSPDYFEQLDEVRAWLATSRRR